MSYVHHARGLGCLKGASSWLTALLLDQHYFLLHKGDFCNAVVSLFWMVIAWPSNECICVASFTVNHAFTCLHGGYPTLCHNEIRDIIPQLMSEVYPGVATDPTLQPVTNVHFSLLCKHWDWCSFWCEGTMVLGSLPYISLLWHTCVHSSSCFELSDYYKVTELSPTLLTSLMDVERSRLTSTHNVALEL